MKVCTSQFSSSAQSTDQNFVSWPFLPFSSITAFRIQCAYIYLDAKPLCNERADSAFCLLSPLLYIIM